MDLGTIKCKQCGMCCRCLVFDLKIQDISIGSRINGSDKEAGLVKEYFRPVSKERAMELNPHLVNNSFNTFQNYYTCTKFNAIENKCMAHDGKQPIVCSGYPAYGYGHKWHKFVDPRLYNNDCVFADAYRIKLAYEDLIHVLRMAIRRKRGLRARMHKYKILTSDMFKRKMT